MHGAKRNHDASFWQKGDGYVSVSAPSQLSKRRFGDVQMKETPRNRARTKRLS